jgi:precorrin isomerase
MHRLDRVRHGTPSHGLQERAPTVRPLQELRSATTAQEQATPNSNITVAIGELPTLPSAGRFANARSNAMAALQVVGLPVGMIGLALAAP